MSPAHVIAAAGLPCLVALALATAAAPGTRLPDRSGPGAPTIALVHGRWLRHDRFVPGTRYLVGGRLEDRAPTPPDSAIDLQGGFVIPPFGEAHNHNVEASARVDALLQRYLRDGVYYVENPDILPRNRWPLAGEVNVPTGPDVIFANGGLTGSGGHPLELVRRNVMRGIWTEADGEGQFYWTIDDSAELTQKWPAILAQRPDFIKVYLLHSEEYERRKPDTTYFGWKGLDPKLVPAIVRRAHAAHLRVAAHIETAADFRAALAAGVDQIAHMPGFRGDEHGELPDPAPYTLTDADARAAARRGTTVVTTLGGAAAIDPLGPDSLRRRAFDRLNRRNLRTLLRAGVRLALGSDSYRDDSKAEAAYLHTLGVFSDTALVRLWAHDTPRAIFPGRAIGRLAAGDEASFLVLACDPLRRFVCTDSIRLRVKDARVLALPPPG